MAHSDFRRQELQFIYALTMKMLFGWVPLPLKNTGPYAKHRRELMRIFEDLDKDPLFFQRGEDRFVGILSCYHAYAGRLGRPTDEEFKNSVEASVIDGLIVNGYDVWGLYREPIGDTWFSSEGDYCIAVRFPKVV